MQCNKAAVGSADLLWSFKKTVIDLRRDARQQCLFVCRSAVRTQAVALLVLEALAAPSVLTARCYSRWSHETFNHAAVNLDAGRISLFLAPA